MIPKTIHYCWLGDDPFPEKIQRCINSWKACLPDYEFVLWNKERFDIHSVKWVEQAYECRKYAFAADYIRAYALSKFGGIYLDSDVEVLKNFDDLLQLPYFMGTERYALSGAIEAAVIGAEPDTPFFNALLNYYEGRSFVTDEGTMDMRPLPLIFKSVISQLNLSEVHISDISGFDNSADKLCIFPVDYFSPKDNRTQKIRKTENTYAIHHFAGSWNSKCSKSFIDRLHKWVGDKVYYSFIATPYFTVKDFARRYIKY